MATVLVDKKLEKFLYYICKGKNLYSRKVSYKNENIKITLNWKMMKNIEDTFDSNYESRISYYSQTE